MLYLRVLNKILYRIHLTGFYHGFEICQDSEYIRVLKCQVSLRNAIIEMLDRVLIIPQALHIPEF